MTETASDHQTLHVRFREEHYKGIVNEHVSDLLGTLFLSYGNQLFSKPPFHSRNACTALHFPWMLPQESHALLVFSTMKSFHNLHQSGATLKSLICLPHVSQNAIICFTSPIFSYMYLKSIARGNSPLPPPLLSHEAFPRCHLIDTRVMH